jgi:protein-disulfide isomerase
MTKRKRVQPALARRERRAQERLERSQRERPTVGRSKARRPAWQSPFAIVSVGALAIALVVILLNQKATTPAGQLITPPVSYAGATVSGQSLGSATAPVVLAVYSDFQCPFCGQFVRQQFGTLKTDFVDKGILRIETHDLSFLGRGSPNESEELAIGARCAATQGKYWPFHDYVFWNQQPENSGAYTADYIASLATAAGLDMSTWNACLAGSAAKAAVAAETSAAQGLGVSSTPTISLNGGALVAGVPSASTLADQIRQLAAAAASPGTSASPGATVTASP